MNEIEKQIGDGIDAAHKKLVVDTMVNHAAQSQTRAASHELNQTEFVRLTGQPWHGDSANLIQLQCRVGCSETGPFVYSDRISLVNVMKRSEWVEPTFRDHLQGLRGSISELGERAQYLRGVPIPANPAADINEARANITLAFRHLEDARMRLGKAIQALDGGVSCYDQQTNKQTNKQT